MPSRRERAAMERRSVPILTQDTALAVSQSLEVKAQLLEKQLDRLLQERAKQSFVVSRRAKMLRVQAQVHNLAELIGFLQQLVQRFVDYPMRTPTYFNSFADEHTLSANTLFKSEYMRRYLIYDAWRTCMPPLALPTPTVDDDTLDSRRDLIKESLVDTYFSCQHYLQPLLVRSYYLPRLKADLNSMLTNALAAWTSMSECNHITLFESPEERRTFAEQCYVRAVSQLRDDLFDQDEHSIDTVLTLWFLGRHAAATSRRSKNRAFISMAWRLVSQLQHKYSYLHEENDYEKRVLHELWKRSACHMRLLFNVTLDSLDTLQQFKPIVVPVTTGFPSPLPCEEPDARLKHAVQVMGYQECLNVIPGGRPMAADEDEIHQRLLSLSKGSVRCKDIKILESQLLDFWYHWPAEYHLADGPIAYLDPARLENHRTDACTLHLNLRYYMGWLLMEGRLIEFPALPDLSGASLDGPIDSARATLIVSVCCDAMSKIVAVLRHEFPCMQTHTWETLIMHLNAFLLVCSSDRIRETANDNIRILSGITASV
ncbi:hypothetical protein BCR43DRAFT_496745 [Syncephalastrum racemosum]|uniref:Transcription factor domain-containing protein n=1 Tax=Syncephalastrum racemosum TaxID=13706 RepID=A0A1X2H4M6_SYNRA|nr:hypothetical protein BCR43DRAFT_496745 [Syncephalastrum racemosum]